MAIPVPGFRVGTGYGVPGRLWAAGHHTGVDFPAPVGTPIVSMTGGHVIHVGWGGWGRAYGAHVIVDDGHGHRHGYMHMSAALVGVGATVAPGTQLGRVGLTGNTTGAHCHVESRHAPFAYGNDINPTQFFGLSGSPTVGGSAGGVYLGKLKSGQRDSDSVRALQRALNGHHLAPPGNITLPITGNFGPKTEQVVVACQVQHGFGHDAAGHVSVGPRQAAHLGLHVAG